MELVLHSKRLTLSPLDPADIDIVLEIFTDPQVRRHAGGPMRPEKVYESMPSWVRRGGNGCIGVWCIAETASGEKLGTAALLPMPVDDDETDWDLVIPGRMPNADVEVGYFLKLSAWGRGYATESCRRLVQAAFEDSPLEEIVATFDPGNQASRNVLLKSGFSDRGSRQSYGEKGPYFGITREEWRESSNTGE